MNSTTHRHVMSCACYTKTFVACIGIYVTWEGREKKKARMTDGPFFVLACMHGIWASYMGLSSSESPRDTGACVLV